MSVKRFTNVTLDFENEWIKLYDNGLFFIVPIHFTDKEEYGLPTLEDLLNELNDENKELEKGCKKLAMIKGVMEEFHTNDNTSSSDVCNCIESILSL